MTEVKLNHQEFIIGINENEIVPWVDINKGHALMKTSLAPASWRLSVKFGTYLAILLIPSALALLFFLKWWIPTLMILFAIVLTRIIRNKSKKGVITQSIKRRDFYDFATSTDTLRIYRASHQPDREQGNTVTGIMSKGLTAQAIINKYTEALAIGSRGIARPISYLTHPKDLIKQSYADYVAALKQAQKLDAKIVEELRATYSSIDHFIDDKQAHVINRVHEQVRKKEPFDSEEEKIHRKFVVEVLMSTTDKMKEFDRMID